MENTDHRPDPRKHRTICLPFSQEEYSTNVEDPSKFRSCIDERIRWYPELFPPEIEKGYRMKDISRPKKQPFPVRRIKIANISYTIRPSFIMPYGVGFTDQLEKALFLRKFSVPFWALSYVFGKDPMYWHRIEQSLGNNSIVGTTVRKPENIPEHLGVDEKHSWVLGDKVYVATTVGNECILGASIATDAGEEALKGAYQIFKAEAQCLNPDYSPTTVNMDGWMATRNAWSFLFTSAILIYCFLHVFIKIRDRAKKKYQEIFSTVASKLWDCYNAESKSKFSQRVRRLAEWCKNQNIPKVISGPIEKMHRNIAAYKIAYDFPGAQRTSNMLDRLMQKMDRHLFSTRFFHGSITAAELSIRGWALIHNFSPCNPRTVKHHNGFQCPAERLNRFRYHDNWLHNLLASASLGGYRSPPLNPI